MIVMIILGLIIFSYIGYVVGLSSYCRQIPTLKRTKEFVWLVPIIIILYPFTVLLSPGIDQRLPKLIRFLHIPEKGLAFTIICEKMLFQEEKRRSETSDIIIDIRKPQIVFPNITKWIAVGKDALQYYSKSPAT